VGQKKKTPTTRCRRGVLQSTCFLRYGAISSRTTETVSRGLSNARLHDPVAVLLIFMVITTGSDPGGVTVMTTRWPLRRFNTNIRNSLMEKRAGKHAGTSGKLYNICGIVSTGKPDQPAMPQFDHARFIDPGVSGIRVIEGHPVTGRRISGLR